MTSENGYLDSTDEDRLYQIIAQYLDSARAGDTVDRQDLFAQNPNLVDDLQSFFIEHDQMMAAVNQRTEPPLTASAEAFPSPTMPELNPPTLPGDATVNDGTTDAPLRLPDGAKVRYFGDYELLEEIARGGMGVVYRARQVNLNRIVAVKMILSGRLADDDDVARFRAEAEAAANLQHPNIVAIHEVGEYEGQHYFSMDYVVGQSLAELVREHPLPAGRAAETIRTVAEAVDYAHRRGVIHRDLKPANVLMAVSDEFRADFEKAKESDRYERVRDISDRDGRSVPKITDFGLAKQVEAGSDLTATGQILGTPSYMPPEQAGGKRDEIGPASDVYSLGAILYELLTGRPPFRAAAPLDTLMQVIEAPVVSPRMLNPTVPRDLETICLKCLQKDPEDRYQSARDLSEDIGRFLNDEPIHARRIGRFERARRWLWKRRRSVAAAMVAAIAASLLVIAGIAGWNAYQKTQTGYVVFESDGPSLVTEIFDESGNLVLPEFTTPTLQPVALPEGSYRARFSAPEQLSEEYQLLVERENTHRFNIALEDRRLWPPLELEGLPQVIRFDGAADVVVVTETGAERLNGATGQRVWETDLSSGLRLGEPNASILWNDWAEVNSRDTDRLPRLVRPAPDVNGDGAGDLLWAGGHPAALVAVSGEDGRVLWTHVSSAKSPNPWKEQVHGTHVVGQPSVADVNGDGAVDVIATFHRMGVRSGLYVGGKTVRVDPERWVEAISGPTGEALWRFAIERDQYQGPFAWTATYPGGGTSSMETADDAQPHAAVATIVDGEASVLVPAGKSLIVLDSATGSEHPIVHQFEYPIERCEFADLNGDGQHEAVLLVRQTPNEHALIAVSPSTPKPLWRYRSSEIGSCTVSDLDADGQAEILIACTKAGQNADPDALFIVVRAIEGRTGEIEWEQEWELGNRHLIDRVEPQIFIPADVDGDGILDLCVATKGAHRSQQDVTWHDIAIHALSGKDGRRQWHWTANVPEAEDDPQVKAVQPWQLGPDGVPLLIVWCGRIRNSAAPPVSHVIEGSTGRTYQKLAAVAQPYVADLNRDGIDDLCWIHESNEQTRTYGSFHALQGQPPVAWRRLGRWERSADLNGDGVVDLLGASDRGKGSTPRRLTAISGSDGSLLWQAAIRASTVPKAVVAIEDSNGDGLADVLVYHTLEENQWALGALSGSTGRSLWTIREIDSGDSPQWIAPRLVRCTDLDGDGQREIVFGYQMPENRSAVAVISASRGQVRWNQQWHGKDAFDELRLDSLIDLDGDGVLDPLVLRADHSDREYRALSGRDGKLLWQRTLPMRGRLKEFVEDWSPLPVGDVTGDGTLEVVIVDDCVEAFSAADGKTVWTWQWHDTRRARSGVSARQGNWIPSYDVSPAVLARMGTGVSVCVLVEDRIVLLDGQGRQRDETPLWATRQHWGPRTTSQLSACDLDGDGKDELLLVCAHQADDTTPRRYGHTLRDGKFASLRALDDDARRILWEWPFPYGFGEVLDVRPADGKRHVEIVVRTGNRILGLSGPTGEPVWRCEGVRWWFSENYDYPEIHTYLANGPVSLRPDKSRGATSVLFRSMDHGHRSFGTVCRLALPTSADGLYRVSTSAPFSRPIHSSSYHAQSPDQEPQLHNREILARLHEDFPHVLSYQRALASP